MAFEDCAQKYKFTPWKHELFKHFIEIEDSESLQKSKFAVTI